jgi:ribosomal RNA-processing protein 9
VTSAVASHDAKYLFTAGKEGSIIKWNFSTGKKLSIFHKRRPKKSEEGSKSSKSKGKQKVHPGDVDGHTDEVLALALSEDGKYLVSGGKDRNIGVWDVEKGVWVKGFSGHRDTISVSFLGYQILN